MEKSILTTEPIFVYVEKKDAQNFKNFAAQHGIMMKVAELDGYETLFPHEFLIYKNTDLNAYVSVISNGMCKKRLQNCPVIQFAEIENFVKLEQ